MKEVDIISKVVGRAVDSTHVPSATPAVSVDLSGYLLKSVWDSVWEVRKTEDGTEYVFGKLPVALQYGLTFFVDGGNLDLPGIYAGLPIDNQTIYWEEVEESDGTKTKRLKAKGGGGGGSIEYPLSWSGFSSGSWDGTEAKSIYIPSKVSELTNDSSFITQSGLSNYLADYLPLSGGTLTGDLRLKDSTNYGRTLYFGDGSYAYITEDSDDHLKIYANSGIELAKNVTANNNLDVLGSMKVKGTKFQTPAGSDTRGFEFEGQFFCVHWDYVSREVVFHLDGNNVLIFKRLPQVTANGYLATQPWVKQNYIESIANVQATTGGATFDRYLGIKKDGSTTNLTVGYATLSGNLKAYGVSDLSTNSAWNTYVGLKCSTFSSSASGVPTTPGSNANSIITHMPIYNYGVQIAHICELASGLYPSGVHLFARTLVNGSYKSWRRIITNGSTMTFEAYATVPYINLISNSVTYKIQANSGLYLGVSTSNGIKIDSSGNLLATGSMTFQSTSDKRLKSNIRDFNACEELMSLGGVYKFEYNDNEVKRNPNYKGTHIGLIYQNVKGTSLERMCMEREDGFGALNYIDTSFISLLAGVGMEHETRIRRLERENEELRMEVEFLKKK